MKKMFAVLKREYLQAVRKKSFLILTVLMPGLFAGMIFIPALLASKAFGSKNVVVVDGTGRLGSAVTEVQGEGEPDADRSPLDTDRGPEIRGAERQSINSNWIDASGSPDVRAVAQPYLDRMTQKSDEGDDVIDGVVIIPGDVFENPEAEMSYFSRSATELIAKERIGRSVNREIQRTRLAERGLPIEDLDQILKTVPFETVQLTRSGEEKRGGELGFVVAFLFAGLLMFPSFLYGTEVMRGIIQEKTDRVVEILISSMKPIELLAGKVLGLAAVGLTQLAVWIGMAALLYGYAGSKMPAGMIQDFSFVRPAIGVYFMIFFILAYLQYVCVYAIAGAVCNTEKEAQQFITPVILILLVPWILMMPIVLNPESTMSVGLSLFPLFAPITMFVRILVSEPAFWQVALAVTGSILAIWVMFWVTAKIFRVGILSYGKRPTIPELWRWLKVA